MRRRGIATATVLLLALIPASTASASIYTRVLQAYETNGSVPPCAFTSGQLAAALKGVDTYGAQYFADFTNAIQSALSTRAAGACSHQRTAGAAPVTGQSASEGALALGPVTASTDAGVPAPIVLMAALAAAFGLLGAAVALARMRGWDPAWAAAWRHAWGEAGHRTADTWSEFRDWLRSGR